MNLLPFAARVAIPVICVRACCCRHRLRAADVQYVVKPVAEMKVKQLPKGPLYWRVENFPTLDQAKAAASEYRWNPDTVSYEGWPSLTAEVAGKAWLFTLGPQGAATPGGTKVAEIGPVPPISAPEYLLRVNYGSGPPGAKTPVHFSFWLRSLLRHRRKIGPEDAGWHQLRRGRPHHERTYGRDDDASLQRRHDRSDRPHHVRGRCHQTVLGAGQVALTDRASPFARTTCRMLLSPSNEDCNETSDHGCSNHRCMRGDCYSPGRCPNRQGLGWDLNSQIGYQRHSGWPHHSTVWAKSARHRDIRQRWSLRDRQLALRSSKICLQQSHARHGGGKRSDRAREHCLLRHLLGNGRRNYPAHRRRNLAGLGWNRSEANYHLLCGK